MPVSLPVVNALDAISISTACPVSWSEMEGNDRTRFCARCQQQVHDISELTTDEALALVSGPGKLPCVRIYRRNDGRVMTADCRTKRERVWKWLRRYSGWAAAIFAVLFLSGCRMGPPVHPKDKLPLKTAPESSETPKSPTP